MIDADYGASSVYFLYSKALFSAFKRNNVLDDLANSILPAKLKRISWIVRPLLPPAKFLRRDGKVQEALSTLRTLPTSVKSDKALAEAIDVVERLQKLNEGKSGSQVTDILIQPVQRTRKRSLCSDSIVFRRFTLTTLSNRDHKSPRYGPL